YQLAKYNDNQCFVSLEERMACGGAGSCLGCSIPMNYGKIKYLCQDGPFFNAAEVDWLELLKRDKPAKCLIKAKQTKRTPEKDKFRTVITGMSGNMLVLNNPFMIASGCDNLASESRHIDLTQAGAVITKGIRLEERAGNKGHRVAETPCGMINSIGLAGKGLKRFIKEDLPSWQKLNIPVIANISGSTPDEYAKLAFELFGIEIKILEINVSCPNLNSCIIGKSPELTGYVCYAVRKAAPKAFLIVKLPPADNAISVAKVAIDTGADAVTLINTIPATDVDLETLRPVVGNNYGGLSGEAIYPVGLEKVSSMKWQFPQLPIFGAGGIINWEIALKYFAYGASAIQVGTGAFTDPEILIKIRYGIEQYMLRKGFSHISQIKVEDFK
ncbi:MAG: dihydroorotate dehydrogenase, partial [Patescibacteria group bacterium]